MACEFIVICVVPPIMILLFVGMVITMCVLVKMGICRLGGRNRQAVMAHQRVGMQYNAAYLHAAQAAQNNSMGVGSPYPGYPPGQYPYGQPGQPPYNPGQQGAWTTQQTHPPPAGLEGQGFNNPPANMEGQGYNNPPANMEGQGYNNQPYSKPQVEMKSSADISPPNYDDAVKNNEPVYPPNR